MACSVSCALQGSSLIRLVEQRKLNTSFFTALQSDQQFQSYRFSTSAQGLLISSPVQFEWCAKDSNMAVLHGVWGQPKPILFIYRDIKTHKKFDRKLVFVTSVLTGSGFVSLPVGFGNPACGSVQPGVFVTFVFFASLNVGFGNTGFLLPVSLLQGYPRQVHCCHLVIYQVPYEYSHQNLQSQSNHGKSCSIDWVFATPSDNWCPKHLLSLRVAKTHRVIIQ